MRVAVYTRVSTEAQGDNGYSLKQQEVALREHCQQNAYEIVGEFQDQASGAYLNNRPGLDALRDLVADEGVDIVLAQDADRITRDPIHRAILDDEFGRYETRLVALDDWGDDSHEGELLKYMKGWVSKGERLKIAERTRRGKLQKARQGLIVGSGKVNFGYTLIDGHYFIDPEHIETIRGIYLKVAQGFSINSVARVLGERSVPSASGGEWTKNMVRALLRRDVYFPFRVDEIEPYVSPTVLKTLDPEKHYGIYWFNRERTKTTQVSAVVGGEKVYRSKVESETRPESEWIAVPVPDAGIPRDVAERAREKLKENVGDFSRNADRVWELTAGIAICAFCGAKMHSAAVKQKGRTYFYYRCSKFEHCESKYHRAVDLESYVAERIKDFFSGDDYRRVIRDHFDKKIKEVRRRSLDRRAIAGRIEQLRGNLDRATDALIDGLITKSKFVEKTGPIHDEISTLQDRLDASYNQEAHAVKLREMRDLLLKHHFEPLTEATTTGHRVYRVSDAWASEQRFNRYKQRGLRVLVGKEVTLELDGNRISQTDSSIQMNGTTKA